MFPLKKRIVIRGAQEHIAAGLGAAEDTVASIGTPVYAPFDGTIETYWGTQGGNWSRLIRENGDRIEMAHLSAYVVQSGKIKEGELIAYTGNTGSITTGPHLHLQILRNGKRLDPAKYPWDTVAMPTCEQQLVVANEEIRKLNTEIGKVTGERDAARKQFEAEKVSHQNTIDVLKGAEAKLNQIKGIVNS